MICSIAVIHLFLRGSFMNPFTLVGHAAHKAAQVIIKPAPIWERCKTGKTKLSLSCIHFFFSIRPLIILKYALWSPQGPCLTVMSSMAINPLLVVLRWAANISCGRIFTLIHYAESMKMFDLMRSRNRLHESYYLFYRFSIFWYFLALVSIVNPVTMTWTLFFFFLKIINTGHYYKPVNDLLGFRKNKNNG